MKLSRYLVLLLVLCMVVFALSGCAVSYTIAVSANTGGSATILFVDTYYQSLVLNEGYTVQLIATADEGYEFYAWLVDGQLVSTDATYTVEVAGSYFYTAVFTDAE